VILHDLLADGESYAGAGVDILCMKPLENLEYLLIEAGFESYSVVAHFDHTDVVITR
jgi:hypothetical protein